MKRPGEVDDWDLPQSAVNDFLRSHDENANIDDHQEKDDYCCVIPDKSNGNYQDVAGLFEQNVKSLPYSLDLASEGPTHGSFTAETQEQSVSGTNEAMLFYTGETITFEPPQRAETFDAITEPQQEVEDNDDDDSSKEYEGETLPISTVEESTKSISNIVEVAATQIATSLDIIEKGSTDVCSQTTSVIENPTELIATGPHPMQSPKDQAILPHSKLQPPAILGSETAVPMRHQHDVEEDIPTQVALSMDFIETGDQMSFGNTDSGSSVLRTNVPGLPNNDLLSSNTASKNKFLVENSEKISSDVPGTQIAPSLDFIEKGSTDVCSQTTSTKEKPMVLISTSPHPMQSPKDQAILPHSKLQPPTSLGSETAVPMHHQHDVEEDIPTQVALSIDFIETGGQTSFGNTENGSSVLLPITDTHALLTAVPGLPKSDLLSSRNVTKSISLADYSDKVSTEVNNKQQLEDVVSRIDPNRSSPHGGGENIVIRNEVTNTATEELNETFTSENEFTDSEHAGEGLSDFDYDEELSYLSNTQETPVPQVPKARRRLVQGIRRQNGSKINPMRQNDVTEKTQDEIEETRKIIREQERRVELHKEKMREENRENLLLSKYVALGEENSRLKDALRKSHSTVQELKASMEKLNQKFLLAQAQIKKGDEEIKLLTKRVEQKNENILLLKKLVSVSSADTVVQSDERTALLKKLVSDTDSEKKKHAKNNNKTSSAKKNAESLPSNQSRSTVKKPSSLKKNGATSTNPTPELAMKKRHSLLPAKKPSSLEKHKANLTPEMARKTRQSTGSIKGQNKSLRSTLLPSPGKKLSSLKKNNQDFSTEECFQFIWQDLVESGWSYRAGPEPFNMVYVPPHGSTKKGAQESVDFYTREREVINAAHALGHLPDTSGRSNNDFVVHEEESCSTNEPECSFFENLQQVSNIEYNGNSDELMESQSSEDDSEHKFEGTNDCLLNGSFFTSKSLQKCARCMKKFCTQLDCDMKHFRSQLWKPIWKILNSQGNIDKKLRWTYTKSTGLLVPRTWIYGTPHSRGSRLGKLGIDYFITEESVITCILGEIMKIDPSLLDKASLSKISELFPPTNHDDDIDNSATTRSLRKSKRQPEDVANDKSVKQARVEKSVTISVETENATTSGADTICLSQSAVSGVQMLLEMSKTKEGGPAFVAQGRSTPQAMNIDIEDIRPLDAKQNGAPNPDVGTDHGPLNLAAFRKDKFNNREDILPAFPAQMNSSGKTVARTPIGHLHISQSPSVSLNSRNEVVKHRKQSDLLKGFSFLLSGCSHVSEQVDRMGGNVVETVKDISLKRTEVGSKLFFLSEPSCRRRTKYLLAVALGLPMLHYHCLSDLEHGKFLSLFDNELYKIWRLPTGLSIFSGVFVLQRARHACVWAPPGLEDGQVIFQGMTLILALEEENLMTDWTIILESVGATVVSARKRMDSVITIDAVLIDSMVTATPPKIEAVLRSVDAATPVVDLSWAVQSLIARKKLSFNDDERFIKGSGIHSIKVKGQERTEVRYERGDTVKIRRNIKGDVCHARIKGIHLGERMLSVEILDPYRENTLVDGGTVGFTVKISEKDLLSHVILFSPKEYKGLKYAEINRDIFMLRTKQAKP